MEILDKLRKGEPQQQNEKHGGGGLPGGGGPAWYILTTPSGLPLQSAKLVPARFPHSGGVWSVLEQSMKTPPLCLSFPLGPGRHAGLMPVGKAVRVPDQRRTCSPAEARLWRHLDTCPVTSALKHAVLLEPYDSSGNRQSR